MNMVLGLYNYWIVIFLMMTGFLGKVSGGTAPIMRETYDPETLYSNPLPSVLMLTAIVVGIATSAVALALIIRIKESYGTIEEDEIAAMEADG